MRLLRTRHVSPSPRMPPALKYRRVGKVGKVGKMSKAKGKKQNRSEMKPVRMCEWLEKLLDEESCKGLVWMDKLGKTFEITWCHASRHDFEPGKHADVFIQYSEFTGRKYVAASSKNGYNSKLKSNFRSALHSLVDCIQVKDAEKARDRTVKVYQFIEPSHPEYRKRKAHKNNSQRKNKMRKASPSCKTHEVEAVPEDILQDIPVENIILPEEAVSFLQNQKHCQFSLDEQVSPALPRPSISTSMSVVPVPSTQFHDLPSSSTAPPSTFESSESWLSNPEKSIIFYNKTHCEIQPTQQLPDFTALGVDDTFQRPVRHACPKLSSGGTVRVKKEKVFLPQLEVENYLIPTEPIIIGHHSILNMIVVEDPFLSPTTTATTTEPMPDTQQYQVIESNAFPTEFTDGAVMFSCDEALVNSTPEYSNNSQRVYVELENVDTNLQGENYDLFNVGNF